MDRREALAHILATQAMEPPTAEQERELLSRLPDTEDELYKRNIALIASMAQKYANQTANRDVLDLFQEGSIGFMKALRRWDGRENGRLSTYAIWWIDQGIRRHLDNTQYTVRRPAHVHIAIRNTQRWLDTQGDVPRIEVVEHVLKHSTVRSQHIAEYAADRAMDRTHGIYLDASLSRCAENRHKSLHDAPAFAVQPTVERDVEVRELLDSVRRQMTPQRWHILKQRLSSMDPVTLRELGETYGITRERVRQIQVDAHAQAKRLLDKLEGEEDAIILD